MFLLLHIELSKCKPVFVDTFLNNCVKRFFGWNKLEYQSELWTDVLSNVELWWVRDRWVCLFLSVVVKHKMILVKSTTLWLHAPLNWDVDILNVFAVGHELTKLTFKFRTTVVVTFTNSLDLFVSFTPKQWMLCHSKQIPIFKRPLPFVN